MFADTPFSLRTLKLARQFQRRFRLLVLATVIPIMGLSSCATGYLAPNDQSDIELTWLRAAVAIPPQLGAAKGDFVIESLAFQDLMATYPDWRFPVVVYLHGCTGLKDSDRDVLKAIARAGFIVVAPDSMARRYRPRQCNPRKRTGGFNLFVYDFRQAEINFALQMMADLPWVDRNNLFLVGSSEGGLASALYRGSAFRARVITKWTCHGSPLVRGLSAPSDEPVLAIVRKSDPWYDPRNPGQAGNCGAFMGERPGSRSWVIERGSDHNVLKDKSVVEEVIEFLSRHRVTP